MPSPLHQIQNRLKELGFDPGPIDGLWGPKTQAAVWKAVGCQNAADVPSPPEAPRESAAFSERSLRNLAHVHPDLQRVLDEAIQHFDFTVICGYRGRDEQEAAVRAGTSHAHFGSSPHNYNPALAVDCIPHPFTDADWKNEPRFCAMADAIKTAAVKVGVAITWGGDFRSLHDTPHFELKDWRNLK